MLKRLIPYPDSRRVFKLHAAAMALLGLHLGVLGLMPMLLRRSLQANEWQTTLATMCIPAMAMLTLFWNEIYTRVSPRKFLIGIWLSNYVPLAGISFCDRASTVLGFFVLSTMTFGAASLFHADVLRRCYPAAIRNRLFAVLNSISLLCTIASAYTAGRWLDVTDEAYRIYLPLVAMLAGVGILLLMRIAAEPMFRDRPVLGDLQPLGASLLRVVHRTVDVFRRDTAFRQCEAAFFVYGLGYMSCYAVVPFLVCDKLDLEYAAIARSTQVAYSLVMLFTSLAGGYLMDRLGALRVTTWSLVLVIFYPIGLMLAVGETSLTCIVIYNAVAMTGVQLAGTMLPLALAQRDHDAATYVGIHTSLIGPRAIIGNVAAVALYDWTGRVEIPLAISAVLYAGGAVLMIRLELQCRRLRASLDAHSPPSPAPG